MNGMRKPALETLRRWIGRVQDYLRAKAIERRNYQILLWGDGSAADARRPRPDAMYGLMRSAWSRAGRAG